MNARLTATAVVLVLAGAGLSACSSGPSPSDAVTAFLKAWSAGDLVASQERCN